MRPGECVAILGPSGAGKSTLLKLVAGIYDDGGAVRLDGRPLADDRAALRRRIGVVPQDDIVHPSLTPRSELTFAARLRRPGASDATRAARVDELLGQLELAHVEDVAISRLSGGQRKRVSVGVELLVGPPLLALDEPTSGLDPALEQKMMELFSRLAKEGRAVLVTTHVMESLDAVDQVLVLMRGHLVFFGPPKAALNHFGAATFSRIYQILEKAPPEDWRRRYRESPLFAELVTKRLREPVDEDAPPAPAGPAWAQPKPPPTAEAPGSNGRAEGAGSAGSAEGAGSAGPAEGAGSAGPADPAEDLDAELAALREEVRG